MYVFNNYKICIQNMHKKHKIRILAKNKNPKYEE
jgi:hypothetical protein